jgi:hypothetical protein
VEHQPPPGYDHNYLVRQVHLSGDIKFMGRMFYITPLFAGKPVGLREIEDGLWQLRFSFYVPGSMDSGENKFIRN